MNIEDNSGCGLLLILLIVCSITIGIIFGKEFMYTFFFIFFSLIIFYLTNKYFKNRKTKKHKTDLLRQSNKTKDLYLRICQKDFKELSDTEITNIKETISKHKFDFDSDEECHYCEICYYDKILSYLAIHLGVYRYLKERKIEKVILEFLKTGYKNKNMGGFNFLLDIDIFKNEK